MATPPTATATQQVGSKGGSDSGKISSAPSEDEYTVSFSRNYYVYASNRMDAPGAANDGSFDEGWQVIPWQVTDLSISPDKFKSAAYGASMFRYKGIRVYAQDLSIMTERTVSRAGSTDLENTFDSAPHGLTFVNRGHHVAFQQEALGDLLPASINNKRTYPTSQTDGLLKKAVIRMAGDNTNTSVPLFIGAWNSMTLLDDHSITQIPNGGGFSEGWANPIVKWYALTPAFNEGAAPVPPVWPGGLPSNTYSTDGVTALNAGLEAMYRTNDNVMDAAYPPELLFMINRCHGPTAALNITARIRLTFVTDITFRKRRIMQLSMPTVIGASEPNRGLPLYSGYNTRLLALRTPATLGGGNGTEAEVTYDNLYNITNPEPSSSRKRSSEASLEVPSPPKGYRLVLDDSSK